MSHSHSVLIHSLRREEEIGRIHANVYDLNPPGNSEKLVHHVFGVFKCYGLQFYLSNSLEKYFD